jgi:CO dehydrogenase nickel-insertion accessory protein CooC1
MAGQVIAVLNMKGGVGKTTVSPHVMRVLYHNMQRKILLVDLDPQFYLTQCLMSWVATKRRRSAGHIFQKRTARVDRSAYRPSKTRWRKEQSSWAGGYEQDFLPNGWQTRFGNVATDFFFRV